MGKRKKVKNDSFKTSDFKGKKLTDFIKLQTLKYFRFDRQFELACTEAINKSDVSAVKLTQNTYVEVEVKISWSDFLKEFSGDSKNKTKKHYRYNQNGTKVYKRFIRPNYYYFCTTKDLAEDIVKYLEDNGYTKYGVLVCEENRLFNKKSHISVYKSAKRLTSEFYTEVIPLIYKRLSSEVVSLLTKQLS